MSIILKLQPLWIDSVSDPFESEGSETVYHSGRVWCEKCNKNIPEDLAVYGSLWWGQPINHYCKTCVSKSFVSLEDYQEAEENRGF